MGIIEVHVKALDLIVCTNSIERQNVISHAMWNAGVKTQTVMGEEVLGGVMTPTILAIVPAGPYDLRRDNEGGLIIRATNPH